MTEDDTFRVLRQRPYEEVKKIGARHIPYMDSEEEVEEFLLKFGWTFDEFCRRLEQDNI